MPLPHGQSAAAISSTVSNRDSNRDTSFGESERGGPKHSLSGSVKIRRSGGIKRHPSHWRGCTTENVHNSLVKCRGFPLTKKLLDGKPEDTTDEEVQQVFDFMKAIDGFLEVDILLMYLREVFHCRSYHLEPLRLQLEEAAEGGSVSCQIFHDIICGPGCEALLALKQQHDLGVHVGVSRDLMVEKMGWRVDRDEALATLPLTVFYMVIFLCLVIFHLQIYERQQLERGIQSWIEGYGRGIDGPYLGRHVHDVSSFFTWLEGSGLPSVLSDVRNGTKGLTANFAVSSQLLGDVKLEQRHFDGAVRSSWLLSSAASVTHLAANPGALTAAAINAARSFRAAGWANRHNSQMSLAFIAFHEGKGVFVLTRIVLLVNVFGHVHASVSSTAVPTEPYPFVAAYPLDAIYLILLLHIMRKEIKEIWLGGLHGFRDYWSVWNVIDWMSISLGFVSVGLWFGTCLLMSADELHKLLIEDSSGARSLKPDIMRTSERDLDATLEHLELTRMRFFVLHLLVACNTVSIIMRFFKAFQSNQRLNIVAKTFASCYQDIVHFMIVFLVIFLCMAMIGHVLFGNDVREFHSMGSSLNTCFMVLMGDFGWYAALGDTPEMLPSGIPRILMVIWFFAYMFLVAIVLLNMLLAIILEKYSEVGAGPNERTLWMQAYRFFERWQKYRKDIPLARILAELEDKKEPAHPSASVSMETLKSSFKGMSTRQAEYLMDWLEQEAFVEETAIKGSEDYERLSRTSRLLESLADRVQQLVISSTQTDERLLAVEEALGLEVDQKSMRSQDDVGNEISPSSTQEAVKRVPEEQVLSHTRELPQSVWKQKQAHILCCCASDGDEDERGIVLPDNLVHGERA